MGGLILKVGSWVMAGVGLDRVVREWLRGGTSTSGESAQVVVAESVGKASVGSLVVGAIAGAVAVKYLGKRRGR